MKSSGILVCLLAASCGSGGGGGEVRPGDGGAQSPADAGVDAYVPPADAAPFTQGVSTLAGVAEPGAVDGDRNLARFANPVNVARGLDGMIYVADFDNSRIRAIDPAGVVSTVIRQTGFARPFGMTVARDGTLFVSTDNDDTGGHSAMSGTVWRVDIAGRVATVVAADIGRPRGLAALPDGRLAIADNFHHVVRLLDPATGKITTIAGLWDEAGFIDATGDAARFARPYGIAVRPDGNLVVADFDNHRIPLVDPATGEASTLAGTGTPGFLDASCDSARFSHPQGVAIDAAGTIYVTDLDNFRIRRLRQGVIDTVAGDGTGGYRDHDDPRAAELYGLEGLSVAPDGSALFVADGTRGESVPYNRVRRIELAR